MGINIYIMVGMQTKEYKLPSKVEDLEIEFSKHMDSLGEMWCLCAREWLSLIHI